MKTVMAECGGKSPHIVFNDGVDLDDAATSIAQGILLNQGQLCSVGSRVLVHRSVQNDIVQRIIRHFKTIVMGSALDPGTTFGPLVSARQLDRVMQYISSASQDGAQLASGGRKALPQSGGYFVEPTIFYDVPPVARIAQEEIFGPVLSVIPFETEAEAVRIANSTIYGLFAYVWTANLSTAMRLAKGIRSSVMINAATPVGEGPGYAWSHEPTAHSGIGSESGLAGMESYLRRHSMWFNHA
jgi:acyl-CoA reductase-like NAD-dependent aldehyde dehydrogenase